MNNKIINFSYNILINSGLFYITKGLYYYNLSPYFIFPTKIIFINNSYLPYDIVFFSSHKYIFIFISFLFLQSFK